MTSQRRTRKSTQRTVRRTGKKKRSAIVNVSMALCILLAGLLVITWPSLDTGHGTVYENNLHRIVGNAPVGSSQPLLDGNAVFALGTDHQTHGPAHGYNDTHLVGETTPAWMSGNQNLTGIASSRLPLQRAEQNIARLQVLMSQAAEQARNEDRTGISERVEWRMLWLVYPNIEIDGIVSGMTAEKRGFLRDVMENFKQSIESVVPYISIQNNIVIMEDVLTIPRTTENTFHFYGNDYLMIRPQLIQGDLDNLSVLGNYDNVFVITGIDSQLIWQGGLAFSGVDSGFGYTTVHVGRIEPINDMKIPSAVVTRVAIHEWLHTLEGFRNLLDINFPLLHGWLPKYENYENFVPDPKLENWQWDQDFLNGQILYRGTYRIGMFPKMWRLTPRLIHELRDTTVGTYTIRTADGRYLFREGTRLLAGEFISGDGRFYWTVNAYPQGGFTVSPRNDTTLFLEVVHVIGPDNNSLAITDQVGLQVWTDHGNWIPLPFCMDPMAHQVWFIRPTNSSVPSYQIISSLSPNSALALDNNNNVSLAGIDHVSSQVWIFEEV